MSFTFLMPRSTGLSSQIHHIFLNHIAIRYKTDTFRSRCLPPGSLHVASKMTSKILQTDGAARRRNRTRYRPLLGAVRLTIGFVLCLKIGLHRFSMHPKYEIRGRISTLVRLSVKNTATQIANRGLPHRGNRKCPFSIFF